MVLDISPQARIVFHLTVDVRNKVINASPVYQHSDIVIVDRSGQHLAQVAVYLLCGLGTERLVGKVGIGVDGERLLLGVELEPYELARAHLHIGRFVMTEVCLQSLLYRPVLRLRRYMGQRDDRYQECIYYSFHHNRCQRYE